MDVLLIAQIEFKLSSVAVTTAVIFIFAIIALVRVYKNRRNIDAIMWTFIILMFPLFGSIFFLCSNKNDKANTSHRHSTRRLS